jgi:hypothetical protein
VCQLGLSADSAGKLGGESEEQGAETAEQTAGTAEQDVGTAAAQSFYPVPKADGVFGGGLKHGRDALPN